MSDFSQIKRSFNSTELLQRALHLKQLQLNGLLNMTQAINNNISAIELFKMYKSFLSWEIGISRMALYVKDKEEWICATWIGLNKEEQNLKIGDRLEYYNRLKLIEKEVDPFIATFDVIIPVQHKQTPIAYVLIGNFEAEDDMYAKVQFITAITNIIAVAIENKRLFKKQLEQERMRREMELAGEMQRMLIPKELPSTKWYEFDCIYKPHYGVGGDYYDVISVGEDKIVFCVGDISGKGVAAAILMANFQANFHTLINKSEQLDNFIIDLNKSVNLITEGDKYITLFIGEFNFNTKKLKYINAGHSWPVVYSKGNIHFLKKGSTFLGSFKEITDIEIGEEILDEDAFILTYTDGLTDLKNEDDEFLKPEFLHEFVRGNHHLSAAEFNKRLMVEIEKFKGSNTYPDDFTVLSCKLFK